LVRHSGAKPARSKEINNPHTHQSLAIAPFWRKLVKTGKGLAASFAAVFER
jgi:hypothetical protein